MPRPNYEDIKIERVSLPYSSKPFLKLSFVDPALAGYQVLVVEDSLPEANSKDRLTTITARFARNILAEVNTHRVFGRNSASSRARSVKVTFKEVMEAPYIPIWTVNQKGMSGKYASEAVAAEATKLHLLGRDKAVATALSLLMGEGIFDGRTDTEIANDYENILDEYYRTSYTSDGSETGVGLSLHKQNVNRGLEPYMYHEAIITGSYWDNFLELRTDESAADPAIYAMALLVKAALEASEPEVRALHLPFISADDRPDENSSLTELRPVLMLSATECAQISYKDKITAEKSTATTKLGESLLTMKHFSPFEHQGFAAKYFFNVHDPEGTPEEYRSNLDKAWVQLRPVLAGINQ